MDCVARERAIFRISEYQLDLETALRSDTGSAIYAELRLGNVILVDRRLYLDWDGIRNVRKAEMGSDRQ